MNIIIFAGGSGKRFWPLSRKAYPKQFQPIIENKSTIELMVERIAEKYGWDNIYMPTTELLVSLVKSTFPSLPTSNIFTEPTRRDLGAAVGLAMIKMRKMGSGAEPVAILWSDSYPTDGKAFLETLEASEKLVLEDPNRMVFLGEKPTSPNYNLGWIELGRKVGKFNKLDAFERQSFKYRPDPDTAKEWFKQDKYVWNTGYHISTPDFILSKYKEFRPDIYKQLEEIEKALDTEHENEVLGKIYPKIDAVHFDNVVAEHLPPNQAVVLKTYFKWSDPGTLYALKEFLQEKPEDNVKKGLVYDFETKDSLIYNFVKNQMVTTIGLEGFVVVNTPDALLVVHKDKVGDIKKMLEEWEATELEKYT